MAKRSCGFRNICFLICLYSVCILQNSCESDNNSGASCDLVITVTGKLSGDPRNNLEISIYTSKEDAEEKENSISYEYTDESGVANIYDLNAGTSYWIRAQDLFTKSIKQTDNLRFGTNYFHIKIL